MNSIAPDFSLIALATIFYLVINFTWYSRWLFGDKPSIPIKEIIFLGFIGFIISYFLFFFEAFLDVTTISDGMLVALSAWIGFVLTNEIISLRFQRKTRRQFFIDGGASLLSFIVVGGLVGG